MLLDLIQTALSGGEIRWLLISFLLSLPVILFSLSFHEYAHAFAAHKMGDQTARNFGRLTLNPAKHLDPMGTLCMLVFGFGWAKPVPVNARNFDDPRKGMALTSVAGPLSNLLLAFVSLFFSMLWNSLVLPLTIQGGETLFYLAYFFGVLLDTMHWMNLYLALFNLLPIPPLDGSRLMMMILPEKWYFSLMQYERYTYLIVIVLLATGILSGALSTVSDWISIGMRTVIGFLPFV